MKYYTLEATQGTDGTYSQALYAHDTYDNAVAKYHEFMHYQMIVGTTQMALCMVISEQGVVSVTERWDKPVTTESET